MFHYTRKIVSSSAFVAKRSVVTTFTQTSKWNHLPSQHSRCLSNVCLRSGVSMVVTAFTVRKFSVVTDCSGNVYSGSYHHVNGSMADYHGEWVNAVPHGNGVMNLANGVQFSGQFAGGVLHGQGVMRSQGDVVEGEWKGGLLCGPGKYTTNTGAVYEGVFDKGTLNGKGTMKHSGNLYTGNFVDNLRQGQGHYKFVDGGEYTGEWLRDKCEGQGSRTWQDGSSFTGLWKEGNPSHGVFSVNGQPKYEGDYQNGVWWGKGKLHINAQDILFFEGDFVSGQMETGRGVVTFKNGDRFHVEVADPANGGMKILSKIEE